MIVLVIVIILIAAAIYFWDDFPKWIESAKKFWNEIPTLLIKPKVKGNVTQEDVMKIRLQQKQQMAEAKRGFQDILESRKPQGYTQRSSFQEKFSKFENQTKSKSKSKKDEKVTEWERKYLWDSISRRKRVPCINCEMEDMYKGKTEGPYQYWYCSVCGQGIKLSFYANTMAGFQCENLGKDQNKKSVL